ncbi:ferritin-like fold-containing protein [Pilimelia columellifera]|uniref:Ferritin-like domain-containing protein n=1 Tax=Pilimelia columellifera subsp. columellifera TaxID=706583 RepID=A0ABN3NDV6_9ACTN
MPDQSRFQPAAPPDGNRSADPTRAEGFADLLGLLAMGALLAFDRIAADARLAPDLARRAALSEMAAAEVEVYRRLAGQLEALGVEPEAVMAPYLPALEAYHARTVPTDWWEALTKAYVGNGIADDFHRVAAGRLDPAGRDAVLSALHASAYQQYAAVEIRTAIDGSPELGSRLSMWARRLVGEGLSQAQSVAAGQPALARLVLDGDPTRLVELHRRLVARHSDRMAAVGLSN